MAFKLAGQNPAVEALIYRPSDRSELQTMELRPGMDGFDGPPTLETIGPYNPSEDRSEVIPLELAQQMLPGHYRVPQWVPQGYQNDPTLNDLLYRSGESSTHPSGPKLMEKIPNYVPEEDPGIDLLVKQGGSSDPRFAAVETILPLLVGGVPGSSPYDTFNPSDYDPLLRPENQWDRYEEPSEPEGQLELPIELAGNIYPKDQQPQPEKWPSRNDPVKGLRTDWKVDPHMGEVAPFVRRV